MKFLDLLAKLGILRYGAKAAVYRSGRDRPVEFMQDDVFNAERDLTRLQDVKDALLRNTEGSVARGTFGAPTFFVGEEMFFGKDRLRDVEEEIVAAKAR